MIEQSHEHLTDLQLSVLHDRQSSPAFAPAADAHVRQCDACTQRLNELRTLSKTLTAASLPVMSQIAQARLRRNVLAVAAERGVLRLAEIFSGVAAAVLVGGLLWLSRAPANPSAHEQSSIDASTVEAAPPWVDASAPLAPKVHNVTDTPAARWYLADTSSHVEEAL